MGCLATCSAAPGAWNPGRGRRPRRPRAASTEPAASALDAAVPRGSSTLRRAELLSRTAAEVGFDWDSAEGIFDKIVEEVGEVRDELLGDLDTPYESRDVAQRRLIAEEVGDLLFSAVVLARTLKVDPDAALELTCDKFERRFRFVEDRLHAQGKSTRDTPIEEMHVLWEESKRSEY